MILYSLLSFLCLCLYVEQSKARFQESFDLTSYITRPDIRAPKLYVKEHDPLTVRRGHIFTAPYHALDQKDTNGVFTPFQTGPHIYDNQGDLIWSGADITRNMPANDFKTISINGTNHLSFLLDARASAQETERTATAIILNDQYDIVYTAGDLSKGYNMHEFTPLNDARTFLRITDVDRPTGELLPGEVVFVLDPCAIEVDRRGEELFRFCPSEHLALEESLEKIPSDRELRAVPYDAFHMNSIDKYPNGDYLVSIRHTCGIYRISQSGELVWRLGGRRSDFQQDFNFSAQHNARIVSANDTVTVVSFLDNGHSIEGHLPVSASMSSFKVVALFEKESPKRAILLKQFNRPDGRFSHQRGNGEYLSDGGAWVGWSFKSMATQFAPDGHVVKEISFYSTRFNSYRTYQADWTGRPSAPPDLRTFASQDGKQGVSLISYVSWNGATDVARWEWLGANQRGSDYESLGRAHKTGFETSFVVKGGWNYTKVQAQDAEGNVQGESEEVETEWSSALLTDAYDAGDTSSMLPGEDPIERPTEELKVPSSSTSSPSPPGGFRPNPMNSLTMVLVALILVVLLVVTISFILPKVFKRLWKYSAGLKLQNPYQLIRGSEQIEYLDKAYESGGESFEGTGSKGKKRSVP